MEGVVVEVGFEAEGEDGFEGGDGEGLHEVDEEGGEEAGGGEEG